MFAGYETSSVTTSWALYFLSQHPEVQEKLRTILNDTMTERKGIPLSELTASDLDYDDIWCDEIKYLDHILAETLRLWPPVPGNDREATTNSILPLMTPIKLTNNTTTSQLVIKKGTRITVGIKTVNYNKHLFGADADEFRPERFDELPESHANAKFPPYGTYSFIGGPKSCIGSKFALTEMKVLIIAVLAKFELKPEPGVRIKQHQALIVRPRMETEKGTAGAGMPLRVRKLSSKA
ncbi:hypothetical protein NDA16_001560 [Ustilago loliicola]|nr:hypothetical protein NDA16_001560 [Ustilago loliicola]